MEQGWLDLGSAAWTVRADSTVAAWDDVPDAVREAAARGVAASVPGCVHTDLIAAHLLSDPYVGAAEAAQDWIGAQTWIYRGEFLLQDDSPHLAAGHRDLICDGLDTVAEVFVNGASVGRSVNMHRRAIFDVHEPLRAGANVVEVVFSPALEYIAAMADLVGERTHVERDGYNLIRKMACNFGWDWGPRLVTAGIWKTIGLRSWDTARILDLSVHATAEPSGDGRWAGRLDVAAQVVGNRRFSALTVRVRDADGVIAEAGVAGDDWVDVSLAISEIQPWWPHSLGGQPLYEVEVVLHNDVAILDRVQRSTGFRSVSLDTTADADGSGARFGLVVNGVDVFVRGANWIPDDCFVSRVTAERYRERIQQAKDANIDLLRVWGGGIYETEAFYQACDELGMMVWQDFTLACAAYPEEEPFRSEIEAEARDNVMRLSAYPSLAIWNGNNENIWGYQEWDWQSQLAPGQTWGAGYYYELFPQLLAELDPSRPYWHGSPSSGSPEAPANDPNVGCMHVWDVWNQRDYTCYDDYSPRFVSEFGYQGPATWATWALALDPSDRRADSPVMRAHQKAAGGNDKLNSGISGHLPLPAETAEAFDDWLFAMQVQQARAVRYGIERWRSLRGRCLGSIVWQLNDCWPVVSWAALDLGSDADGRPVARRKPLWYALRSVYADHFCSVQSDAPSRRLVLVNDGTSDWAATGELELRRLTGEVVWAMPVGETLPPRSRVDLPIAADVPADASDLAWVVSLADAERYVKLLAEDVDAHLEAGEFDAVAEPSADGVTVTVTARTFLRSLCLFPDRVSENAYPDSLLIDLFPGESHSFQVTGRVGTEDLAALTSRPVLRSVTVPLSPHEGG